MIHDSLALPVLAWLLTYALHSTLLLGIAWLATRGEWTRSARVKEILWRTALLGGLFTASVQLAVVRDPFAGRWHLGTQASAAALEAIELGPALSLGTLPSAVGGGGPLEETAPPTTWEDSAGLLPTLAWTEWAFLGWALGGVVLLTLLSVGSRRLSRRLAGRKMVLDGPLPEVLARLRRRAGIWRRVRLSVSPGLDAPVALGILRPEICLPPRALSGLAREQQEAMLAHELAHVARLDPLWLEVVRAVQTLFFFQPLNRVARRRLGECAEFLCDDWAVAHTGDPVGLAGCLAEVARWIVGDAEPLPACSMADLRSPLGERVERLLDEQRRPDGAPAWLAPLGAALLSATAMVAPGFARTEPAPPPEPEPSLATPPPPSSRTALRADAPAAPPAEPADPTGRRPLPRIDELRRGMAVIDDELTGLGTEIAELRDMLRGRAVSPETRAALERIEHAAAELRRKERIIQASLNMWPAPATDRD